MYKISKMTIVFLYSILAALHYDNIPPGHRYRVTHYTPLLHTLNYVPSQMPMFIKGIPKFERENPNIHINVFKYHSEIDPATFMRDMKDDEGAYKNPYVDIVYRSIHSSHDTTPINLLVIEEPENPKFHYAAIIDLNRLLNTQSITDHPRIQNVWCPNCALGFRKEKAFENHKKMCDLSRVGATAFTMPEATHLRFKEWRKTVSPVFVVYADFESLLTQTGDSFRPQKHEPCAAAYLLVCTLPDSNTHKPQPIYRKFFGANCVVEFLDSLEEQAGIIQKWYNEFGNVPMNALTMQQEMEKMRASKCYMCQGSFGRTKATRKVRDHCHFSGEYLGAACNSCNLARQIKRPFLPVVFHNLRGYDMHHILKHGLTTKKNWDLSAIPQSSEKFLALFAQIKGPYVALRFIDSLQHLSASLSNLVNSIPKEALHLTSGNSILPEIMKSSKGVFPYSFAKSLADLTNSRDCLPPRVAFFDEISQTVNVSEVDYRVACQVWDDTECKSLKDYMMHYLMLDVYLLADVFTFHRQTTMNEDGLEALNFYSMPGLSWDAAIKTTLGKPLKLLDDPEMYSFFESSIRGGMTFVNKHRVTASADTNLLYIDINNLYGWALSQPLPTSDFEWVSGQDNLDKLLADLPGVDPEGPVGYQLEVDLHTPAHLHDRLDQLPPAPISEAPPQSKNKVKKLLLTHADKHHYVIHFSLLQCYLKLGVQVTQIHRAIKFTQTRVFQQYIDQNSRKRALATTKFVKDFYKLKNNSLYGKTVENLRKRYDIRLCNSAAKLMTYASRPYFKRTIHIAEDLEACLSAKDTICLDRPIYIGQAVLDLSKKRMYDLQYVELEKYREKNRNCKINIIAGDTDSFFLEVKNVPLDDLRRQMQSDGLLDTSNFPVEHPLYSSRLTARIGLFKDECAGRPDFREGIFLRPKQYSLLSGENSNNNVVKAKGVMLRQAPHIDHASYATHHENCLKRRRGMEETMVEKASRYMKSRRIGTDNHQLFTFCQSKLVFSLDGDDKRAWIDGNTSLAYGHHNLPQHIPPPPAPQPDEDDDL